MEYIKKLYLKKSILSLGPVLIDKIINLSEKDKRPSIFNTSIFDNIGAFFMSCDHIIDNIYLGSCLAACDYELLLNNNTSYDTFELLLKKLANHSITDMLSASTNDMRVFS